MSQPISKELKRKLVRFYNEHADYIDPVLDGAGKSWDNLSVEEQKRMYKQTIGQEA